jgi:outer membrane receptor protein involved in Fe transport
LTVQIPGGGTATLRIVYADEMFFDPANTIAYDSRTVVDLFGSWPLSRSLTGYLMVTNLLDEVYAETVTPTFRRGAPLEVRLGVRLLTSAWTGAGGRPGAP